MGKRILIAEDEKAIREFVVINLQRAGYETVEAGSGDEALALYNRDGGRFDVAVLDIMMPGQLSGLDVCKELRRKSGNIGIIMLSARAQEMDKVSGLMMGADEYVTKPFSPSELVARVDAVYRRVALAGKNGGKDAGEEIQSGEFVLNLRNRYLTRRGVQIELTQVEFQIIEYFFTHPGTALSRTDILHHVWGGAYVGEEKIVDVNIRRLRMKVEDQPSAPRHIVTVWGYGYRWEG